MKTVFTTLFPLPVCHCCVLGRQHPIHPSMHPLTTTRRSPASLCPPTHHRRRLDTDWRNWLALFLLSLAGWLACWLVDLALSYSLTLRSLLLLPHRLTNWLNISRLSGGKLYTSPYLCITHIANSCVALCILYPSILVYFSVNVWLWALLSI